MPHGAGTSGLLSRLEARVSKLEERSVRLDAYGSSLGRVSNETWITMTASVWLVGFAWMLFVSAPDASGPDTLPPVETTAYASSYCLRQTPLSRDGLGLPMLWDSYSSTVIPDKSSEGEIVLWHSILLRRASLRPCKSRLQVSAACGRRRGLLQRYVLHRRPTRELPATELSLPPAGCKKRARCSTPRWHVSHTPPGERGTSLISTQSPILLTPPRAAPLPSPHACAHDWAHRNYGAHAANAPGQPRANARLCLLGVGAVCSAGACAQPMHATLVCRTLSVATALAHSLVGL
jgi:hypothetical protein